MSDKIDTSVPINLHPQSLANFAEHLDVKDTIGAEAIQVARNAMQAVHDGYAAINAAEAMVRRSAGQVRVVDGRKEIVAVSEDLGKAAQQRFNAIAPTVDTAVKKLKGIQQVLEKRVNEAISDPQAQTAPGIALASEVRAHIKAMQPTDRTEFVRTLVTSGDKRSLHALLSAPGYLSGLDAGSLDTLRALASNHFAKQDYAQMLAVQDTVTRVTTAGSVLLGRMQRAVAAGKSPKAAADAAIRELARG
jgi:hypothetical protein